MKSKYRSRKKVICLNCHNYFDLQDIKSKLNVFNKDFECKICRNKIMSTGLDKNRKLKILSIPTKSVIAASEKEAIYYVSLEKKVKQKEISGFLYQVPMFLCRDPISKSKHRLYYADFIYLNCIMNEEYQIKKWKSFVELIGKNKFLTPENFYQYQFDYLAIVDTKGFRTELYKLKRAIIYEKYGILITEV